MENKDRTWWKEAIIYQIYPRSFMDSNGDGIGDLQGIISKLDYIKALGVDVIWISPFYQSPNDDNGYDISDYRAIGSEFGGLSDFDELLEGIHTRGMKLIMDLVVNHTSDEHEWFEQSKSSVDNPYRDYYIWRKGEDNKPPTNWPSFFGGSTWKFDETTGEYFLHLFTKKQPDLNWENENVIKEVYDVMKFWLDKGIDGFRLDVIPLLSKTYPLVSTEIKDFNTIVEKVYSNGPRVHEHLKAMNTEVFSKYDIMTVGEGPGINKDVANLYVGKDRGELNLIFHLDHMFLGHGEKGKFDPYEYGWKEVKSLFNDWDKSIGDDGWISIFMDNHDFPRLVSRFGDDGEYRIRSAKALSIMILTLRGTPCIYQGTEIGMTNVAFDSKDEYRDVEIVNFFADETTYGYSEEKKLKLVHEHGRDNARTPMQWSNNPNGGFSTGTPWLKANPNYNEINVVNDYKSKDSLYKWYQELITYRKANLDLTYGEFAPLNDVSDDTYIYSRVGDDYEYLMMINHSIASQKIVVELNGFELQICNMETANNETLLPWEGRIYRKPKVVKHA